MKLKRFLAAVSLGFALAGRAHALVPVYTGNLVNEPVCIDISYQIDLNYPQGVGVPQSVDQSAWQANYSSYVPTSQNFDDGRASTGSITVTTNSNFSARAATDSITLGTTASLAAVKSTDSITVASNTALSGAVITFNGTNFIEGRDWTLADTATGTAVAIRNVLNHYSISTFTAGSNVVFATATAAGPGGNAFTLRTSSPAALTVASANFTGGRSQALTNSYISVNGLNYRAGYDWEITDTSSGTAVNIAVLISSMTGLDAQAVGAVVTATTTALGSAGNSFTLASSSPTFMTVASANFTGGRSSATLTIAGTVLTYGVDWSTGSAATATSSTTARSISDAIQANGTLAALIHSSWTSTGVVTATAAAVGVAGNLSLATNSASLTPFASALTGGTTADYVFNTATITIASHGFYTGMAVLYSTTSGNGITNLVGGTTYYVGRLDANNFKLASSKGNSISASSGTFIVLASSSTTGPHTYGLAPIALSGTPTFKWQESNDAANWADLSVSSVTFASPYTAASTFWDLGSINARYLRIKETGVTTGCWNLQVIGNGKHGAP